MNALATNAARSEPPDAQIKSSPRDVFMYLLVILMLYVTVSEVLTALFSYIDLLLPDRFGLGSTEIGGSHESIRFAVATLVVVFPVYLWGSRFLGRELAAHPEKGEARIRKWLLYLTLFAAGLLIIGDVIWLVYSFLGGELTTRFILKVLSILAVSAAVFGYYLHDLRREPGVPSPLARDFSVGAATAVAAIIVAGFFVAGSPARSRRAYIDSQRVTDLGALQDHIVEYWQAKNKLPVSLDQLNDNIAGFTPPRDRDTGAPYGYRVLGPLAFELCANFSLPSQMNETNTPIVAGTSTVANNWNHATGMVCFTRTIDSAFYVPRAPAAAPMRKP